MITPVNTKVAKQKTYNPVCKVYQFAHVNDPNWVNAMNKFYGTDYLSYWRDTKNGHVYGSRYSQPLPNVMIWPVEKDF